MDIKRKDKMDELFWSALQLLTNLQNVIKDEPQLSKSKKCTKNAATKGKVCEAKIQKKNIEKHELLLKLWDREQYVFYHLYCSLSSEVSNLLGYTSIYCR